MKSVSSVIYSFVFPYYIHVLYIHTQDANQRISHTRIQQCYKDKGDNISFMGARDYMDVFPWSKQTLNLNL